MTDLPPIHFSDVNVPAGEIDFETCKTFGAYVFPRDRRAELAALVEQQAKRLEAALGNDLTCKNGQARTAGVTQRAAITALAPDLQTYQRYTGLQKVPALAALLTDELRLGLYDRVAVFALHVDVIDQMEFALKEFKPVKVFDGSAVETEKRKMTAWTRLADRFKNRPKCRVALIHIPAADMRIDLSHIDQIVFAQAHWGRPQMNAQAVLRCHRAGQTRSVNVRFIGLAQTLEQEVSRVMRNETRKMVVDDFSE
jgi:SNF2 family DNA or RNA helicase